MQDESNINGERAVRPEKSLDVPLPDGRVRRFSTRDDLREFHEPPPLDPAGTDDRWVEIAREVIRQGSTGCLFAQHRANGREPDLTWLRYVIPYPLQEHAIEDLQSTLAASSAAQAVMLIFPSITEVSQIADMFAELSASGYWYTEEIASSEAAANEVLVGLRWPLPNTVFNSETLAMGPFDSFPQTRQLPVTALVFRTRPPDQTSGSDDTRVHLAQMPYLPPELRSWDDDRNLPKFWTSTEEQKAALLGGSVDRSGEKPQTVGGRLSYAAKAKVTAIFARDLWEARTPSA